MKFSGRQDVRIITITGPSGVGKTTIVGELLKKSPNWKLIVSLTSRGPRSSDLPGEYRCEVPLDEFLWRDRRGEFIWTENVHGNTYGTLLADIANALKSENLSVMQIVPDSVKQLRVYAPGRVLSFFIFPPGEEELRRRLAGPGRKEFPEEIERRIADCKKWEKEALSSGIPYEFVRNDTTVADAVERVEDIIERRM